MNGRPATPPLVRVPADDRRIYLTFDDGPDPGWTPRIAVHWGPLGRAAGIGARLRAGRAGDIILMHDGGRGTRCGRIWPAPDPVRLTATERIEEER